MGMPAQPGRPDPTMPQAATGPPTKGSDTEPPRPGAALNRGEQTRDFGDVKANAIQIPTNQNVVTVGRRPLTAAR